MVQERYFDRGSSGCCAQTSFIIYCGRRFPWFPIKTTTTHATDQAGGAVSTSAIQLPLTAPSSGREEWRGTRVEWEGSAVVLGRARAAWRLRLE